MRIIIIAAVMFGVLMVVGGCATFQNPGPADILVGCCETDIESYCKDMTQGEGQLACLYAYRGKLSNRCKSALYEAVSRLPWAVDERKI